MSERKIVKPLSSLVPGTGTQPEDQRAVSRQLSAKGITKTSKNWLGADR